MAGNPGFRKFTCEECGTVWVQATRDHTSPSGDDCPVCHEFVHPDMNWRDDVNLKTDHMCNLVDVHKPVIIVKGKAE
jgi:hypothetical protein